MNTVRPKLIIIPGIGDNTPAYQTFVRRWNRLGYDTHIIPFGWIETGAALDTKMTAFVRRLDAFGETPLYLIGVSAGGTAAINALAARSNVRKVIAVCSPLTDMDGLRNPLLAASITEVQRTLANLTFAQKQRILSVYGLYDQVVTTKLSMSPDVQCRRIFGLWHAPTIFVALTLYARSLRHFFQKHST